MTATFFHSDLEDAAQDLRHALSDIHEFSEKHADSLTYAQLFAEALQALDAPTPTDIAPDPALPPGLPAEATHLYKLARRAWVFSGANTWSQLQFEGRIAEDYERVSDALREAITEAIAAVAKTATPSDL